LRLRNEIVCTALLTALAACGKKETSVATPPLSAPVSSTSPARPAESPVPAEVEVKASSGPVELSLLIYQTKIRHSHLWYQIRLKNIGTGKIRVWDNAFFIPGSAGDAKYGVYLEVLNSKGHRPEPSVGSDMPACGEPFGPPALTDKEHRQADEMQQRGAPYEEVAAKVRAMMKSHEVQPDATEQFTSLEPGASIRTPPWAAQNPFDVCDGKPLRKPIGEFTELTQYYLPIGKYRIRAVYSHFTPEISRSKYHLTPAPFDVDARTPFSEIEIVK
jgi:hypothetical protein